MAAYKVFFKKSVEKDFAGIPREDLQKILHRIRTLAGNPRPANCEELTGLNRHRLRQGRYRILYTIQDDELTAHVVKVSHRRDAYRCTDANRRLAGQPPVIVS